jgi:hypothetical protein
VGTDCEKQTHTRRDLTRTWVRSPIACYGQVPAPTCARCLVFSNSEWCGVRLFGKTLRVGLSRRTGTFVPLMAGDLGRCASIPPAAPFPSGIAYSVDGDHHGAEPRSSPVHTPLHPGPGRIVQVRVKRLRDYDQRGTHSAPLPLGRSDEQARAESGVRVARGRKPATAAINSTTVTAHSKGSPGAGRPWTWHEHLDSLAYRRRRGSADHGGKTGAGDGHPVTALQRRTVTAPQRGRDWMHELTAAGASSRAVVGAVLRAGHPTRTLPSPVAS